MNRYHAGVIVGWLVMLGGLFMNDAALGTALYATKDFSKNQYEITYLFPLGRTLVSRNEQRVMSEPVYTTVFAPRKFHKARMVIGADGPLDGWQVGIQTGPGFQYELLPLHALYKQTVEIDIEGAFYENNRIRFILSHPEKDTFLPVEITKLAVYLEGHAESYRSAWKRALKNTYDKFY